MPLADRLQTVAFTVDETPHIVVDGDKCRDCGVHTCITFCPAGCFSENEERRIDYYYVGCLECGTCMVLCDEEAVTWNYPRGGYGIAYRF